MVDENGTTISEGMFLHDVRLDNAYVLVTSVVTNTKLGGIGIHKTSLGSWIGPYTQVLFSAATFEILPATQVPEVARKLLVQGEKWL